VGASVASKTVHPVEVINLGIPAVGPSFSRRLWQLEGSRLDADVVLFGFFVGNDFTDEQWAVGEDGLTRLLTRSMALSALIGLVGDRDEGPPRFAPRPPPPALPPGVQPGFEVPGYAGAFGDHEPAATREEVMSMEGRALGLCAIDREARYERLLVRVGETLSGLRDEVRAAGATLCVVVIPDRYQVYTEDLQEIVAGLGRTVEEYDVDRPQRGLIPILEREGILHVDLLPAFRAAAGSAALYNVGDTHWSIAGNALAALEITRALESSLQPPPGSAAGSGSEAGGGTR
jgi:hypothetical protein